MIKINHNGLDIMFDTVDEVVAFTQHVKKLEDYVLPVSSKISLADILDKIQNPQKLQPKEDTPYKEVEPQFKEHKRFSVRCTQPMAQATYDELTKSLGHAPTSKQLCSLLMSKYGISRVAGYSHAKRLQDIGYEFK